MKETEEELLLLGVWVNRFENQCHVEILDIGFIYINFCNVYNIG